MQCNCVRVPINGYSCVQIAGTIPKINMARWFVAWCKINCTRNKWMATADCASTKITYTLSYYVCGKRISTCCCSACVTRNSNFCKCPSNWCRSSVINVRIICIQQSFCFSCRKIYSATSRFCNLYVRCNTPS